MNALETKISKMGFRYSDGEPMDPIVALGLIGKHHGKRYDWVIAATQQGDMTVEQYFMEMSKMIHDYQNRGRTED